MFCQRIILFYHSNFFWKIVLEFDFWHHPLGLSTGSVCVVHAARRLRKCLLIISCHELLKSSKVCKGYVKVGQQYYLPLQSKESNYKDQNKSSEFQNIAFYICLSLNLGNTIFCSHLWVFCSHSPIYWKRYPPTTQLIFLHFYCMILLSICCNAHILESC